MSHALTSHPFVYRSPNTAWVSYAVAACVIFLAFRHAILDLIRIWDTQAEYSFGYAIPFISLFLLWQRKDRLERISFRGSWAGLALVVAALLIHVAGQLGTLGTVSQYALLLVIAGLTLSHVGANGFRLILVPVAVLIFMVPLPNYLLRELSGVLQLVSSELGVILIRLCGISVYLEGNVIDLGAMKLQVVEACSGLRYLFPLMTLGFIAAYFYQEKFWKRSLVFLSTIPITVLMNSLRIGLIGVTVEHWGRSMAEGVLHDFEGWIVFMACMAVMLAEMWLLSRWSRPRRPLREVFGLDFPVAVPSDTRREYRSLPLPYLLSLAALAIAAGLISGMPEVRHHAPQRDEFSRFPMELGQWKGRPDAIDPVYLPMLSLDDYVLADYADASGKRVNFYVSWYASQTNGNSAHSPRACIPGDGWKIMDFATRELAGTRVAGKPLSVNRVVIQKGEHKQLVYYWFQQRGRIVTNEYVVKLYIIWDAITRRRSDGAMVRLIAPLGREDAIEDGDRKLEAFAALAVPALSRYVPD